MRKLTLLVLVLSLLLSISAITIYAEEVPVIKVANDRTTKIIMATQYTEYKDNSEGAELYIASDDIGDVYFDYIRTGDTFAYTIDVESAGTYNMCLTFGWVDSTGSYTIELDGTEVGVLESKVDGLGFRVWTNSTPYALNLSKGQHTLKITNGTDGPNLKYILLTPEGKDITDLGKSVHLCNKDAALTPWHFLQNGTESIDIQFNATAPIEALKIFAPNWIAPAGSEHELEFKLYKWDKSYEKTIAGSPIASKLFPRYGDGVWLYMPVDVEAGEYILSVSNNGTDHSGFYLREEAYAGQRVYIDNVVQEGKSAELIIAYATTPSADYGELSAIEAPETENPQTSDTFAVYTSTIVAACVLVVLKKCKVKFRGY
jgi:hypothetical protein